MVHPFIRGYIVEICRNYVSIGIIMYPLIHGFQVTFAVLWQFLLSPLQALPFLAPDLGKNERNSVPKESVMGMGQNLLIMWFFRDDHQP
jgi:hypothetical protein